MLIATPELADGNPVRIDAAPLAPDLRIASLPDVRFGHLLDQLDYGLVLLRPDLGVAYANRAAQAMLADEHPLGVAGTELTARDPGDGARLRSALAGARRGLRTLLILGSGQRRGCVAVVPLKTADPQAYETLLVIGKRAVCEELSAQWYARSHGLSSAETQVLNLLCGGRLPREIARLQGVAISTIRTQIGSIRAKTGASTVASLLREVAVLPPLVNALQVSMH